MAIHKNIFGILGILLMAGTIASFALGFAGTDLAGGLILLSMVLLFLATNFTKHSGVTPDAGKDGPVLLYDVLEKRRRKNSRKKWG
jgi:hypothetical protein